MIKRPPRHGDLRFEVLHPREPLLQLGDQLRDFIGHRDGLGEPLLLGSHVSQLGLELREVGLVTRQLGGDLAADVSEHHLDHLGRQHVLL